MVVLEDYYIATQLSHIKQWFTPTSDACWVCTGASLVKMPQLSTLLLADCWKLLQLITIPITVQASVRTWITLLTYPGDHSKTQHLRMPFTVLEVLIPYLSMQKWKDQNIQ